MSGKKRNLQIQIQEPGQQCNSKFQGYIQYQEPNENYDYSQQNGNFNNNQIYASRVSYKSNKSNQSNISERSAILQRAEQAMAENRLSQNLKNLSKSKYKILSNSRNAPMMANRNNDSRADSRNNKQMQQSRIPRSKSASSIATQNSRAKILQQIAQKLKKISNRNDSNYNEPQEYNIKIKSKSRTKKNQDLNNYSEYHSRLHSQQNLQLCTVQKIKDLKEQMIKNRGGKLQHLLKDIKKSNKQAYKVVYTIKKSSRNASPFHNNIQNHRQKLFQHTKTENNETINMKQKSKNLRIIADELQNVRNQLKQVKNKNDQLLKISQMRSVNNSTGKAHNIDSASQSSRITNQIQALQYQVASSGSVYHYPYQNGNPYPYGYATGYTVNDTQYHHQNKTSQASQISYSNRHSPRNNSVLVHPPFGSKGQLSQHQYEHYDQNANGVYHVKQPNILQPCFACGCTCKMIKTNKAQ